MLYDEASGIEPNDEDCDETAACDDYVKKVPAVRTIASPAQAIQSHSDVDEIDDGEEEEEIIW